MVDSGDYFINIFVIFEDDDWSLHSFIMLSTVNITSKRHLLNNRIVCVC